MSSPLSREAVVESRAQATALVVVGLGIWFLAILVFRSVGQFLLPPDDIWQLAFVYLATVPLVAMLAFAVYSLLGVPPDRRLTAATLLVLPGMLLGALTVTTFEVVFPNMVPSSGPRVGGLLLLAYASLLFTGVVPLTYVEAGDSVDTDTATTDDATERELRRTDGDRVTR